MGWGEDHEMRISISLMRDSIPNQLVGTKSLADGIKCTRLIPLSHVCGAWLNNN